MKLKDCKVGMKVKCINEKTEESLLDLPNYKKGDCLTISYKNIHGISFKEVDFSWEPKYFEPVNKFEVGDPVVYNCPNGINYKSEIFGVKDRKYAIKYTHKKVEHYDVVEEEELSPAKKEGELEVGDKFIAIDNDEVKILMKRYTPENEAYYFTKNTSGYFGLYAECEVYEIIYE